MWSACGMYPLFHAPVVVFHRKWTPGKDLQLPPIKHVSHRNTNQIVLVKHFLYYLVEEPVFAIVNKFGEITQLKTKSAGVV